MNAKTTAFFTLLSYQLVTALVPYMVVPMGVATVSSLISLFRQPLHSVGELSLFLTVVLTSQAAFILGSFFQKLRFKGPLRIIGFGGMIVGYVILAGITIKGDYGDRYAQIFSYLTGVPFIVLGIISFGKVAEEDTAKARRLRKDMRSPDAQLLDEILSVGMTTKEALALLSENFKATRLPRYYSVPPASEWVEIDTNEATFMIFTRDGKVKAWSAK